MTAILIIGAALIAAFLFWGLVAGTHEDDDDEKEFSGLLEDDE